MRQLRHLLRLHQVGGARARSGDVCGVVCAVARSTAQDNLKRAAAAGLGVPLAEDVTSMRLSSCGCSGAPE